MVRGNGWADRYGWGEAGVGPEGPAHPAMPPRHITTPRCGEGARWTPGTASEAAWEVARRAHVRGSALCSDGSMSRASDEEWDRERDRRARRKTRVRYRHIRVGKLRRIRSNEGGPKARRSRERP